MWLPEGVTPRPSIKVDFFFFPALAPEALCSKTTLNQRGVGRTPKDWTMGGAISASTMFATICAAAIARGLKPGVWR